jgi:adenylate cyclase
VEIEVGVLFADMRGFTALSESKPPQEVAHLLDRFYFTAATVLYKHDAVIDKFVGDEVMALFLTGFTGPGCFGKMATAAEGVLRAVGYGSREVPWLPLGIGMDFGLAFVGNVGAGEVKDFTAIGDVVNTAARLQAEAKPGQIVMSERVYREVAERYPDVPRVELQLKGKSEPVAARVVEFATA